MSSEKPFSIYKHGFSNPHPWSRNLQCNVYMSNGKIALKCPEYKKRRTRLETVVDRISSAEVNRKIFDVSTLDSARPAFLRRNAFKVKSNKPNFNEKKNRWHERLEAAAVETKKEKYTACVKFYYHLETLHGYESFDLTSLEPVQCSTYIPSRSMELVPSTNRSQRTPRITLPDYYDDYLNNKTMEFVMGRSAERSKRSVKFPIFEVRGDIPGVSNKRKRASLPAITTGNHEDSADMTVSPGSFSFIGTLLQMPGENGLLRSFYTCYHSGRLTECDPEEADYESIEQLAMSDLVNHSIENPPPDGLKLMEYSQDEFDRMPKTTQNCLKRWRNALLPVLADINSSEGYQSGYEDENENVVEVWNREVRKVKQRSFAEPPKKRARHNESFESVRSLPEPTSRQVMMEEIVERRTRRILHTSAMSDLRKIDNSTIYSSGSKMIPYVSKSTGPKIVELNNNDGVTPSSTAKHRGRPPRYADENNLNSSVSFGNTVSRAVASTPAARALSSRGRSSLPNSTKAKTAGTSVVSTKTPAKKSLNTSKAIGTPSTVDVFRQLPVANFFQKALSIHESVEEDGILVVGIIGKDSAEWKKSDIANDATQTFVFAGQSDDGDPEIFIETHFIEEELTLYLVLHGIHDVDYQFDLFASENSKNKSFFEKLAQSEYEEVNLLHVIFLLSHLVFFVEQGRYFDTHWLKTLSQINRMRMNNMHSIIKKLQAKEGVPSDWLEHGRLAVPRCCFLFSDKALRYDLHINKKREITEKLEQCWANQIYDNMKLVRLMDDSNMSSCIGHLPDISNLRSVFICKSPKEEPRDILADLVLRLADHRLIHPGGVDDEPDPDCGGFIRNHIQNAFNYGDDDIHFYCFPTLKEFVVGAEAVFDAIVKRPIGRDDLTELIPELELVQSIESSHFEKAFQAYRKALMAKGYFTEQEHQVELNKIIASLPVTGEALAELIESLSTACHDLWWKDHQRCEAVSVTGHNCKHGDHEDTHLPHNSGYRFTSSCNCGRKQMTRNDPFTLKEANYDFYKQGFTCCMHESFYLKFPIFVPEDAPESIEEKVPQRASDEQKTPERKRKRSSPSIQDTSALSGETNTEVDDEEVEDCFDRYLDDDKLKQMFLDEEETERTERMEDMDESPERSEEVVSPIEEEEPAGNYLETYDSQITGLNKGKGPSITYENLLKQYKGQFLEYLPHTNAPSGLLPGFSSWSVFCVGQSNRYSHVAGLRSPNFKHGSDYLLPLDVFITVNNDEWEEDMRSISKNDFKPAPRKATKSPVDDDMRREKLRFFIGFDYECPRGHRFIIEKPGKVLQMDKKQGFQAYKEEAANLLRSDIPVWTPCTCKRSPSVAAQLMRLHVVLPKAPIVAKLDLKVQASSVQQTDGYFYPSTEPLELAQNRYYVVRFPFAYEGPEGQVKLAIVGGGCGGVAVASKFARLLGSGQVAVIEPKKEHYYQPGFTLVGGGIMKLEEVTKQEKDVLPSGVKWINSAVDKFIPSSNQLNLSNGETVNYDFLVVATGLELRFDLIKGLPAALDTQGVCSIYSPKYAAKTFQEIQSLKNGKALFTFPNTPIKCAGAPQKICYIAEDYWKSHGVRDKIEVSYSTSLPKIFGIEVYANALMEIVKSRGIQLHTRTNLISVDPEKRIATFELLDENGKTVEKQYDFLHVGPPCSPVESLRKAATEKEKLVDANGWVDVDPQTLQSKVYRNVFAIGDCANTPNAKTAAAISSQFRALKQNLSAAMNGKELTEKYDGYASCPLVVSLNKVILAEFGPNGPMETLPINQARPLRVSYWMKRYLMPILYWNFLVKGYWNGPKTIRKILHLGLSK